MRYKVKIRDTIIYCGYIEMSEEEYEKLCSEDGNIQVNEIRNRSIITERWDEEELLEFHEDRECSS